MEVPTENVSFDVIASLFGRRADNSVHLADYLPTGDLSGDINYTTEEEASSVKDLRLLRNKGRISLSNVQATALSDTSVRVSWGGSRFAFARVEWPGGFSNVAYGTFAFNIPGLSANQLTQVTVRPVKQSGTVLTSSQTSTVVTLPSTLSTVTTSNISDTSVTVNWSGGTYSYVKVSWSSGVSGNISAGTTSFVVTGLVQNTSYVFTVTPYNSANTAGTAMQSASVNTNSSIVALSYEPFELSIPSIPDSTSWYIDSNNNVNVNGNGRKLTLVLEYPVNIFTDANGPYVAIKDTFSGLYIRHANYVLHLNAFGTNSYDFAFKFVYSSPNKYKIYNAHQTSYVGHDGTYVATRPYVALSAALEINVIGNLNMLPPYPLSSSASSFTLFGSTFTWGIQNQYGTFNASYLFDGTSTTTLTFDTFSSTSPYAYTGTRKLNNISGVYSSISTSGDAFICNGYSYTIVAGAYGPKNMTIIASNDNITYANVATLTNIANGSRKVTWAATTPYKNWYVLFTHSTGPNSIILQENKFWTV